MSRSTRALSRRIAAAAATAVTCGLVALAGPAHATSTLGGSITTDEMMTRAQYWVNQAVPYDEAGTHTDSSGTSYREDCAGFVSMAWHLSKSLIVTDPAPDDFTNTDGTPNTNYDVGVGAFTNLQTGDAMAYPHQHIFLFDTWTNKSTGAFTYYAESNPSDPTHGPTPANINNSTLEGWPTSGYVALRYKKVQAATTAGAQQVQLFAQTPTDLGNAGANYTAGQWGQLRSVYTATNGSPGTPSSISTAYTVPNNQVHTIADVGGHLWIADANYTSGQWSGWMDLEAAGAAGSLGTVTQVAEASIGDKLYVNALVGGQVFQATANYDTGVWSGWANVSSVTNGGGKNFSQIAAATTGNTLHLFALNSDGNIYTADGNYTAGTWSTWQNINVSTVAGTLPAVPTQITAATRGSKVELLALVNNGGVGNIYQGGPDYGAGTWTKFGNLSSATGAGGSNFSKMAEAVTANTLHVFAVNSDGNIYSADGNYTTGQWSSWMNINVPQVAGTMPGGYTNVVATGAN
jgi:hypothetical protein